MARRHRALSPTFQSWKVLWPARRLEPEEASALSSRSGHGRSWSAPQARPARPNTTLPHSHFTTAGLDFRPRLPIPPSCASPRHWGTPRLASRPEPGRPLTLDKHFSLLRLGQCHLLAAMPPSEPGRSLVRSSQLGILNLPSLPQAPPDPNFATTSQSPSHTVSFSAFSPFPTSPRTLPPPCPPCHARSGSDAHRLLPAGTSTSASAHARPRGVLPARARAPRPPALRACALRAAPPPGR